MNEEKDLLDELYNRILRLKDKEKQLAAENDKLHQQLVNALERERNSRDDATAAEAELNHLYARIHQHHDRIHELYNLLQTNN